MAGNYPDAVSWRMAYDVDGTQVYRYVVGNSPAYDAIAAQYSSGTIVNMNDENSSTTDVASGAFTAKAIVFIFPELRDLDGTYITAMTGSGAITSVQVSSNTTNGVDGTWTAVSGYVGGFGASGTIPSMRTDVIWATYLGIKAIRLARNSSGGGVSVFFESVHLYGEPAPGENPQRLEIWHPTLNQRMGAADLDWGNVPRNSTETRQFRVKNIHPTLTANSVRAAMSILSDTTPSVVGQMAISKDGTTFGSQQTLTSPLGPGAISPIMYIRRTTPANATLSLWWYRLFADCSSWT